MRIPLNVHRIGKTKIYSFNTVRNGKHYAEKKVEVFFIVENETIITVPVYGVNKKYIYMKLMYDSKTDLLYIRLDDKKHSVVNRRISGNVVLDIGKGDKIIGIEILDASKHVNLQKLLPISQKVA